MFEREVAQEKAVVIYEAIVALRKPRKRSSNEQTPAAAEKRAVSKCCGRMPSAAALIERRFEATNQERVRRHTHNKRLLLDY